MFSVPIFVAFLVLAATVATVCFKISSNRRLSHVQLYACAGVPAALLWFFMEAIHATQAEHFGEISFPFQLPIVCLFCEIGACLFMVVISWTHEVDELTIPIVSFFLAPASIWLVTGEYSTVVVQSLMVGYWVWSIVVFLLWDDLTRMLERRGELRRLENKKVATVLEVAARMGLTEVICDKSQVCIPSDYIWIQPRSFGIVACSILHQLPAHVRARNAERLKNDLRTLPFWWRKAFIQGVSRRHQDVSDLFS